MGQTKIVTLISSDKREKKKRFVFFVDCSITLLEG